MQKFIPAVIGINMVIVNGFEKVLINEELYNKDYVSKYTEGFKEYKSILDKCTPEM